MRIKCTRNTIETLESNMLRVTSLESDKTWMSVQVCMVSILIFLPKSCLLQQSFLPHPLPTQMNQKLVSKLEFRGWGCVERGSVQFSSVQSLSHVRRFATPWTAACQASLSITNSRSSPKPISIESVMPSNHLIPCCPLLLLPSIFPSIRVFSKESVLHIRWPTYWSFSFFSIKDWFPLGLTGWILVDQLDWLVFSSIQSLSCVWLFVIPWITGMPGLPVHHQLPELTQTHVHQVGDATQPSHPLLSPSLPTFNLSQHQGIFQWVSSLHQVAKVLELQLQQSLQWISRTDFL